MDVRELLAQVEAAFDPSLLMAPYLDLLPRHTRRRLIRSDVHLAASDPSSETDVDAALVPTTPETERLQVASILRYAVWSRKAALAPKTKLETLVAGAFEAALAVPENCARLMTYKDIVERNLAQILIDVEGLTCRQHPSRPPHFSRRFLRELTADVADRWPRDAAARLLQDALDIRSEFNALAALHSVLNVDDRHPLVPTQYRIFMPSWNPQIHVADEIEQVILEVRKQSDAIYRLSGRQFELFLRRIFESFGFDVDLTAAARDGGVDLICLSKKAHIPVKLAVEAKRYAPHRPIDVTLVRSFVGANAQWHANKLVYVTTSRYTRDAVEYAQRVQTNLLDLAAMPDIVRWANDYFSERNVVWPASQPRIDPYASR